MGYEEFHGAANSAPLWTWGDFWSCLVKIARYEIW